MADATSASADLFVVMKRGEQLIEAVEDDECDQGPCFEAKEGGLVFSPTHRL